LGEKRSWREMEKIRKEELRERKRGGGAIVFSFL